MDSWMELIIMESFDRLGSADVDVSPLLRCLMEMDVRGAQRIPCWSHSPWQRLLDNLVTAIDNPGIRENSARAWYGGGPGYRLTITTRIAINVSQIHRGT
jgi:hypothetical protein